MVQDKIVRNNTLGDDGKKAIRVMNVTLEGRFGGPQNRILNVAHRLSALGVETLVVLPRQDSDVFYEKLKQRGLNTRRLSLHRLTRQMSHLIEGLIFFVPEVFSLRKLMKQEGITLVHSNGIWQTTGILAAKLAGARVVLHLNDTLTTPLIKALFSIFGPMCDAYIMASHNTLKCYVGDGPSPGKFTIIHPPVDCSVFDPDAVKKTSEALMKHPGTRITTVSNITPTKALENFITAAYILNKTHRGLSFHIVGPCFSSQEAYKERLIGLIAELSLDNVFFHGASDDVPGVLMATDVFVNASLTESGPMSVFEAMAMQRAVVSTDVGDVSRFIDNGTNGFVVPTRDPVAMADRVSTLIDDPALRARMGALARKVAIRELDVGVAARKHRDFYAEILAGQSGVQ